jgi:hypothetical protein
MQARRQDLDSLNSSCFCISLDVDELKREVPRDRAYRDLERR